MRDSAIFLVLVIVLLTSVLVGGCVELSPPEGKMACKDASECPSGWFCNPTDSLCYKTETRPDVGDAGEDTGEDTGE